jgi:hypothetical protein
MALVTQAVEKEEKLIWILDFNKKNNLKIVYCERVITN